MTVTPLSGRPEESADAPEGAGAGDAARNAPVIVLTYANAGGRRLQQLLDSQAELACTSGTGVLAACDQAAAAWRQVDRRPAGVLSPLASKSIRAMAAQMITVLVARSGGQRWCETAAAERGAAETFLQVFPGTRFVCLHRACPEVISATLLASPWGLSGAAFAPYVAAYPGSTVAALAAWWAARAGPLLAFERDHPGDCLRVRYEDLAEDPGGAEDSVRLFLGLGGSVSRLPEAPGTSAQMTARDSADLPAGQLPPRLLEQVNELHAELGYPELGYPALDRRPRTQR